MGEPNGVSVQVTFGNGGITGKLREGAEECVLQSYLGGVTDKRIVIEAVTVTYRLADWPAVVPNGC